MGLVDADISGPNNSVVSRKLGNGAFEANVFSGSRHYENLGDGRLVSEGGAVGCSDAISMCSLEQSAVGPSHDEIAVKPISSGVTIGKREVSNVVPEGGGVEKELIEQRE